MNASYISKSERLMNELQRAIMNINAEWDEDIAKEVVDKYALMSWRGREFRVLSACVVAEYLMRMGNNEYFVSEIAGMFDIDKDVLLATLRRIGTKYIPDYDRRAEKELGDNVKYWHELKDKVRASPVVLMATIEYIVTDELQREVASKYGISDVALRMCMRKIENLNPELREKLKSKKYIMEGVNE